MRAKVTSLDLMGLWRPLVAFLLFCGLVTPPAWSQEAELPVLFDARERLVRPDVSGVLRLRFLTTTDFPPFNFTDQSGKLSGFHIDLARALCEELGLQTRCQIQALPYAQLAEALEAKQGEAVMAGVAVTPELRERFNFTRPYLLLPARFLMRSDEVLTRQDAEGLFGRKVGVVKETAHAAMLESFFPNIERVAFEDRDAAMKALKEKEISAVFADALQLSFWMMSPQAAGCCRFLDGPLLSERHLGEGMTIMLGGQDGALTAALESALGALSKDGRLEEIYLRYFPAGLF
ncbi:transporter substrate-binding domain-containing protein [Rhizobium rhizophilum]|uniref:Transporter substrate-binding domain-containing protein n=1 Tax=Rhizobium rhizophilum TaxID=1850373 RepID=A0ABY2R0D4_9HYPH|nr:transporter substrate-binding domain-containing protein [Rhizobium rhizophilum]THV17153.1 transporter substrate-binding domain-containing protein [Rhizobium rhizophilum]